MALLKLLIAGRVTLCPLNKRGTGCVTLQHKTGLREMAKKSVYISLRIDPATLDVFRAIAKREDRTLSSVVTRVLANYAKRHRANS